MPSQAFLALSDRLKDLDDLKLAHADATSAHQNNPGRRWNVHGLNRSAILLLSAHLEGYLEDLMEEALRAVDPHLDGAPLRRGFANPRPSFIDKFFALLGITDVTKDPSIHWPGASNTRVRARLSGLVDLRNQIAHGQQSTVQLNTVKRYRRLVVYFTRRIDAVVRAHLTSITGVVPWPD
jgi:RiboL-PSP-HEPN